MKLKANQWTSRYIGVSDVGGPPVFERCEEVGEVHLLVDFPVSKSGPPCRDQWTSRNTEVDLPYEMVDLPVSPL